MDKDALRKCTMYHRVDISWSLPCSTRREELAEVKATYSVRLTYHNIPEKPAKETGTREPRIPDGDSIQTKG
ncbi:hypothetical protein ANO14919_137360 [Xylariales sp. No.14919]|nr:hypothetical protein ANO14919_137360 [Xylariales sp. No.14919]